MALTDNIRAYYKLDESSGNAADSTGNGYTMTNTGSIPYAPALINNGASFSSPDAGQYLQVTSDLGVSALPTSISFWHKLSADISSGVPYFVQFRGSIAGTVQYFMVWYDYNGGTRRIATEVNSSSQFYTTNLGTGWHHFVAIRQSSGFVDLYLDAALVITGSVNGSDHGGTNRFTIGYNYDTSRTIEGLTDEVGFWNRALTGAEVTQLYNGGAGLTYPFTPTFTANPMMHHMAISGGLM